MAQTRPLTLSVADEWVTYFNKNAWKFCFARGVKSGAQEYYTVRSSPAVPLTKPLQNPRR